MEIVPCNQIVKLNNNKIQRLFEIFFSGRTLATLEAYRTDFRIFISYLNERYSTGNFEEFLINLNRGEANQVVLGFKSHLLEKKLSPNTINRRLASIRSFFKLARTVGVTDFEIDVQNVRSCVLRDTRGPQNFEVQKVFKHLHQSHNKKVIRDEAIFRLLHDLALRATELINIDFEDFDGTSRTVAIQGKGMIEKSILSIPSSTFKSINLWISVRGKDPGPLFINMTNGKSKGRRLTRQGLRDIVISVSKEAGIDTRTTHSWRHSSITQAIIKAQENGLGLELVLDHSRHSKSSINLLMTYRDRYNNVQGKIAEMVSKQIDSSRGENE